VKLLKKTSKITTKRTVVYPVTDIDALNLSIIKDEVKDDYHLMVGDREPTETLVNKSKFYHALEKNHIEYPKTYFPNDLESAKQIGKKIHFPVFIRPAITQLFQNAFGPGKGFIAESHPELLKYYRLAESKKVEIMFQEILLGPPENSLQLEGYFDKNFCSTGLFARQRLRIWPLDFGNTTLCTSIPLSKLASESKQLTKFIKNIGYNGVASAEYRKNPKDDKNKILEINARVWFHSWLSAKCGVNIFLSSYLDAIGEKIESKQEYATGVKSIYIDYDIKSSRTMFQRGELTALEWLSSLRGVRQTALFELNDAYPFFVSSLNKLNYLKKINPKPNKNHFERPKTNN
jgi:D-aspartate ligase